ncbi:zinc metallopeptidase [Solemya velesiana gill symbiont]|uniref:Peptidase n=1 Tax=Solemya velesiana gill symbiont TaxID=1918948 RepID=A0A1T2KWK0_9GAMM|nr:zinc metallopeptidase [Solemya velesiana gill symbiont]OOZ37229.1 peptidase [Solemya velesiana gill symbiont]
MHFLLLLIILALLILAPQLWVRHVLSRYNNEDEDFPGSGGELARHLLDRLGLEDVRVEPAQGQGDHYDPVDRAVRLTPDKLRNRTLTAITTAAHEVGHALQHSQGYRPFQWRMRLAGLAVGFERLGSFLLFAVPLLAAITKAPAAGLLMLFAAFTTIGVGVLVQLLTLPVEWDASFGRALPILEAGYIKPDQKEAARRILRACALTYVASSLAGLLNFWRWLSVLRR